MDKIQEELGFCNCGRPEDALRYIRDGLRLINREAPLSLFGPVWDEWYATYKADEEALFGNDNAFWLFQYWVDSKGWTEHGSNIGSQWLSFEGEKFLARLEAAFS